VVKADEVTAKANLAALIVAFSNLGLLNFRDVV